MNLTYSQQKRARLNYQFFYVGCRDLRLIGMTVVNEKPGDWNTIKGKYTAKVQRFGRN